MVGQPKPPAEIRIEASLVGQLLREQAPTLAELPVELMAEGWDNAIYRLGDELLVRLPRRAAAVELVRSEQRWLPGLAPRFDLAVPVPIVSGRPSEAFPWPWSVIEFVPGTDGLDSPPDAPGASEVLSRFLRSMHQPAPPDAPKNLVRGIPLAERDARTRTNIDIAAATFADVPEPDRLLACWRRALEAPVHDGPALWLHGDLHPGNVIVRNGAIVGIIDFGDLTSGDPATDLGCAWMFFDAVDRTKFREEMGVDGALWDRARGWALTVGSAIAANSSDNPRYEALALRILAAVASDT